MNRFLRVAAVGLVCLAGCKQHPSADLRPLDQAGAWYETIQQLRGLDVSDAEVAELVKLKHAGVSDATCVKLVESAHAHKHPFASASAVLTLAQAGFSPQEVLDLAQSDQLDQRSTEALTLRLTGLSTSVVVEVIRREMNGLPTMSSLQIARLKNTGLSEKQVLERVDRGMTDAQAEAEIASRRRAANKTGFVSNRGRRSR
jgi:hypothetical protein